VAILREQAFPLDNYPTGVFNIPVKLIEASVTSIYFEIKRCTDADLTIWPNITTEISYNQEVSFDNGQTWIPGGGFGAMGGIHTMRDGTQAPISAFTVFVPPQQGNKKRRLRATVEIMNGPLRTEGFMELRD